MKEKTEVEKLRDHLFTQMDRLADPNNDLEKELKRADALAKVGNVLINSQRQEIDLLRLTNPHPSKPLTIPLKAKKGGQEGNGNQKKLGNGK